MTSPKIVAEAVNKFDGIRKSSFSANERINEYKDVTTYNYYEFPTDKDDLAAVLAKDRKATPEFVSRHADSIYGYIRAVLVPRIDQEDLALRAFDNDQEI